MEAQWNEQQKSEHEAKLDSAQKDQRVIKRKGQRQGTDAKRKKVAERNASQVLQKAAIGEPTLLICSHHVNYL